MEAVWLTGTQAIVTVGGAPARISRRGEIGYSGPLYASSWAWKGKGNCAPIIRYRVRKPRGLTILENLVASLDAPEGPAKVPGKVKA